MKIGFLMSQEIETSSANKKKLVEFMSAWWQRMTYKPVCGLSGEFVLYGMLANTILKQLPVYY
jgi:hypothetical protein